VFVCISEFMKLYRVGQNDAIESKRWKSKQLIKVK